MVGCTYYLGLSLLAVLEVLGAIEVMLYVEPELAGVGVGSRATVGGCPAHCARCSWWEEAKLVSQLGLFFAAVVGLTLTSYYAGLIAGPLPELRRRPDCRLKR